MQVITNIPPDDLTSRTFSVEATDWVANTDVATQTDYPYVATIQTTAYSANSNPFWQMTGTGSVTTVAEYGSIKNIFEAFFNASGIVLYATKLPTVDLMLVVKGR